MPISSTRARDIMNASPPFCGLETPLAEIARKFAEQGITGILVVDDEKRLLGVITESDLIDQQRNLHLPTAVAIFDMVIPLGEARFEEELERMQALTAEDLMSANVTTVNGDSTLAEVATIMSDQSIHYLPVLDNSAVAGVISKHDVIRALAGNH
ncbi:MAG TPA: CBS domain-containing protein [Mariprofundaceae bacterium]|nr:CBS domain-containing protein [Mariprofundaceae bacterium]